jgi:fatty acid desaturase
VTTLPTDAPEAAGGDLDLRDLDPRELGVEDHEIDEAVTSVSDHPVYAHLTEEDVELIGAELDEIRSRTFARRGEEDARYITRVLRLRQGLELLGRLSMFGVLVSPWFLAVGAVLLALAKILDNMELGHNIMHGQYDFMNDPRFDSRTYEWDHTSAGEGWRRTHNVVHHTYTNVLGVDKDIGYGILRVTPEQWHRPKHRWQPLTFLVNAFAFDIAISLHDLETGRLVANRVELDEDMRDAARVAAVKAGRQALKDFVVFPALVGLVALSLPAALAVAAANLAANVLRNLWTFVVIFCGHFPEGVAHFEASVLEDETRAEWYLRQMAGSANIEGGPTLSLWTGNLDHQIEHHLFPDCPSMRLRDVATEVRDLCDRYDLPYVTGPLHRQFGNVVARVWKYRRTNEEILARGGTLD